MRSCALGKVGDGVWTRDWDSDAFSFPFVLLWLCVSRDRASRGGEHWALCLFTCHQDSAENGRYGVQSLERDGRVWDRSDVM